jgi:myo-inositol 2-dehydrogenase / D-chiro-inositol 1-dehydrogenase
VHDGEIGEVVTAWAYRKHGPVGSPDRDPGMSELLHQIRHYSNFTWLNGSFLLDWLIHNLDVCCWAKNAWPVAAQGDGGRQARTEADQLFDHYSVEYEFPDGARMMAQARHMTGTWSYWGAVLHGTKGTAVMGEGIPQPVLYRGHRQIPENVLWTYAGQPWNPYQLEHDLLFRAIRNDLPLNETEHCAFATMTGILGRMAAESGRLVTWDEAMKSDIELAPGLEHLTLDSEPPVLPDADGRYRVAVPGITIAV